MKEQVQKQFSLECLWSRVVRVLIVGCTWVGANGAPTDAQTWALLAGGMLGASYTGGKKGK